MSSHHIVREKQEPALLVVDIYSIEEELLGQLLEWSPTVISEADSFESITSQSYKIDVLFVQESIDLIQEHIKTVFYESNFVSSALRFLIQEGYTAVNILGTGFDSSILNEFCNQIDIVWLHEDQRSVFVNSGFEKWKAKGEEVYIDSKVEHLKTEGLIQVSESQFETEKDGFFRIEFSSPKTCLLTEKI